MIRSNMPEPTSDFDPQVQAAFDAYPVGHAFTFRRTFSAGDVALFCGITGDFNPYHLDELFARRTKFGRLIVPGLLTGSMITHIGGLLGFLATEMSFQFLAPVFIGDTITCTVTIVEKDETKRVVTGAAALVNQDKLEVARATFKGFPSQARLTR